MLKKIIFNRKNTQQNNNHYKKYIDIFNRNVVGDDQLNIGYSGKKFVSFEYILSVAREHEWYLGL